MSVLLEPKGFNTILRIMNTNVDGKKKIMYAMTAIKGCGRRYAFICLKKAGISLNRRAGELSEAEIDKVVEIMMNPMQYNVPKYMLNRQKDFRTGEYTQLLAQNIDVQMRDDLERLRKIRAHRGIRHLLGIKVRGQHTNSTGRHGKTVGVAQKK
eukprot:a841173_6629.p2 GENE.a841173_6629~~a841173_6629.p2  ORF type:complete len:162 (+),score=63.54 a841173_6629:26-487(+)